MRNWINNALTVLCEVTGSEISDAGKAIMVSELSKYQPDAVKNAFRKCAIEVKGRITLADIVGRIDTGVTSQEAWGLALKTLKNEEDTVVLPESAMIALGRGPAEMYAAGDKIGAKMLFLEVFGKIHTPQTKWIASRGTDKNQAEQVINKAVSDGLLTHNQAVQYLPLKVAPLQLPAPEEEKNLELAKDVISSMRKMIEGKKNVWR